MLEKNIEHIHPSNGSQAKVGSLLKAEMQIILKTNYNLKIVGITYFLQI